MTIPALPSTASQLLKYVTTARALVQSTRMNPVAEQVSKHRLPLISVNTEENIQSSVSRPQLSDLVIDAFISESVAAPAGAVDTIYFAVSLNLGAMANPFNIMDFEGTITKHPSVHHFLSNYMTVLGLALQENGYEFVDAVRMVSMAISSRAVDATAHGGGIEFAKERYFNPSQVATSLSSNPMSVLVTLLRINVEKLLLIINCLGVYKTDFETKTPQAS